MIAEYQAQLGEYLLARKLGKGAYSSVREATRAGNKFAAKYLKKNSDLFKNQSLIDLVMTEAKVMSQLDHPNIVKLYEFSDKGVLSKSLEKQLPVLYLIFELIQGGELFDYVSLTGRLSDKLCRYFFIQHLSALGFLHSKGYAHRDIKCENVLLDSNFNLKLADFGFSAPLAGKDGKGKLDSYKGTLGYMAPEIHGGASYAGDKVDIFASGVLLFIMMAGHPPFGKATQTDGFYNLFCKDNEKYWAKISANKPPGTFSPHFKDLMRLLLSYNPSTRPTIQQIWEHPWIKGPGITPDELKKEFDSRKARLDFAWKSKAQDAMAKKMQKKNDDAKKKAAMGGFGGHPATKAGMAVEKTTKAGVARQLKNYMV